MFESLPGIFERELRRLRQPEEENRRLKQIVAMNSRLNPTGAGTALNIWIEGWGLESEAGFLASRDPVTLIEFLLGMSVGVTIALLIYFGWYRYFREYRDPNAKPRSS